MAKFKYTTNPWPAHDTIIVIRTCTMLYHSFFFMCRPNTVIVKDSRKSDWVYIVMAVSQYSK